MNQILMVEDKKKKKNRSNGPTEIKSIVRFFAIAIIAFGIFFIGQGSYGIYKESIGRNLEDMPEVSISRVNDTLILTVNSINIIEKLKYTWGQAEETVIPVKDTLVEEEIILPIENSILNITIEEESGRAIKYSKEFIVEGLDITKPEIDISEDSTAGNIKITATDETAISYITYQINDEDEIKIDKSELEDKTIHYVLKLQKGENQIIVKAVDESGNIETLEKKIIVSGKTAIRLKVKDGKLVIIVEDPDGIKDIEVNLNGVVYAKKDINKKQFQSSLAIVEGVNTVKITVTNVNSLVTVGAKEFNYAQ